jgi:hypothetical protein
MKLWVLYASVSVILMIFFQSYISIIVLKDKIEPINKREEIILAACSVYVIALSIVLSTYFGAFGLLFTIVSFVTSHFSVY